mgnify:CR=1 FL=1
MVQVIRRAERLPNGRILHNRNGRQIVAPPALSHAVVAHLTMGQQIRVQELTMRELQLQREKRAFLFSLGLDPNGVYRFQPSGEVIQLNKVKPHYD